MKLCKEKEILKSTYIICIGIGLLLAAGCAKNPFESDAGIYRGTNTALALGDGFHFDIRSTTAFDMRESDFAFYERGGVFYLGIGWPTGATGEPNTKIIAELSLPVSEFETVRYPPNNNGGGYKGEAAFDEVSIISNAVFVIYTQDEHFALIGITDIITNEQTNIVFDYVYNPSSDNEYNRTLYEVR